MIESNQQSDESREAIDPLSATGMFSNAARPHPEQPADPVAAMEAELFETLPPAPVRPTDALRPPAESKPAVAGEFTRMFQSQAPPVQMEPQHTPPPASTDFTRIFVPPPSTPLEAPGVEREPMPSPVQAPKSARGFSSPGVSDAAAADGSFTQLFRNDSRPQTAPADFQALAPAPSATSANAEPAGGFTQLFRELPSPPSPQNPLPPVAAPNPPRPFPSPTGSGFTDLFQTPPSSRSAASPPGPLPANSSPSPFPERAERSPQSNFERPPRAAAPIESSQSATDIFSTLSASGRHQPEARSEFDQFQVTPPPAFAPAAPPSAHSEIESGSVTRLIDMLSPATSPTAATSFSRSTDPPQPWANSGPGEVTRIIAHQSAGSTTGAPIAMGVPLATPVPFPIPQIPRVEPPQIAAPKPPAAPVAPMGKLQEMLPILLILNAFLILVLIVVVIFALRHK